MNNKIKSLAACTLFKCERRKLNICCRYCDGYENQMRVSPCKGCEKRELGCHDRCEEYLKYKEGRNAVYEQRKLSAINNRSRSNYAPRFNNAVKSKKKGNNL